MLKYEEYILESQIVELLLESQVVFNKDFWMLITEIAKKGDRVAEELLKLNNTDINVPQNQISLGDKNDSINFTSDKKKSDKVAIRDEGMIYSGNTKIATALNFKNPRGNNRLPRGTVGTIVNQIIHPDHVGREGEQAVILHFVSAEGNGELECAIDPRGIMPVPIKASTMNIGRFVVKIMAAAGVTFTPKEIEEFVNQYKSQYDNKSGDIFKDFYLVDGDDIKRYYNELSYAGTPKGGLWNSCMRYEKCQEFLDIYAKNPNKIKLLILTKKEKIRGRALVWKLDTPDKIFMDRIYTIDDSDKYLFIDYAKKNEWIYKSSQSKDIRAINGPDKTLSVKIDDFKFKFYPYMDTMCYMNTDGVMSNDNTMPSYYKMRGVRGEDYYCPECASRGYRSCEHCGGDSDGCRRCNNTGRVKCQYCANVTR